MQRSHRIKRMIMFTAQDMAKPDTEYIRGLNLAAVKLMTVHVTKLPLSHKINKLGMIYFAKPGWTEGFYIEGRIFNVLLYVPYIHLTKAKLFIRDKPIFMSERMLHKDYDCNGSGGVGE
jgi:hypothetical protein